MAKYNPYKGTGRRGSILASPALVQERQMRPEPSQVAKSVRRASDRFTDEVDEKAIEYANKLQTALRSAASATYRKGTGRFARGIFGKAIKQEYGSRIVINFYNYRETNFLTTLAPYARFSKYPVNSYWIFAKGLGRYSNLKTIWEPEDAPPETQRRAIVSKLSTRVGPSRLKIPWVFLEGQQGKESFTKRAGIIPRDTPAPTPGFGAESTQFIGEAAYVLWVHHPGFKSDVVKNVAILAAERYQTELRNLAIVTFDPKEMEKGIMFQAPVKATSPSAAVKRTS